MTNGAGDPGGHAGAAGIHLRGALGPPCPRSSGAPVPLDILADPLLTAGRVRQIIIGDKNYYGHDFEATLADGRICLLRPARKSEPIPAGTRFFKPLRQMRYAAGRRTIVEWRDPSIDPVHNWRLDNGFFRTFGEPEC